MRFALIPDKFKGSLSAAGVCKALESGIRAVYPNADIRSFAASDGGDGFLDAVRAVRSLETFHIPVEDPLGRQISAPFLFDKSNGEAFIEMAAASGMELLSPSQRDPLRTHTRGTGQLLRAALDRGARHIYVGLGGSATNDGGCGIATVFGYRFLDANGLTLEPTGSNLGRIARIVSPEEPIIPESTKITAVNDVDNPLWGPEGAAWVYATQKGASSDDIKALDLGLQNLDRRVAAELGIQAGNMPGAGAAGGAAFGLHCFLRAGFVNGTDLILRLSGIGSYLRERKVDYLITGEGRIDDQTLRGKLIHGVVRMAVAQDIPVLAVCGKCDVPAEILHNFGLKHVLVVSDPEKPLSYNMDCASELTTKALQDFLINEKK
ncbi:glycerate kinase [Robiginitalea aurantiaca]|uniref:Glycerate kinase n=1 Tax=Robiginitalea aurantiaca TaxID=3056915 RepID=A0ABT7WIA9_9FLAO|nr:glycerate kinase [Robiginitalea aurantiaca]MDM9632636.1 glycerate kinase [Robiginitalea aurantiaca]